VAYRSLELKQISLDLEVYTYNKDAWQEINYVKRIPKHTYWHRSAGEEFWTLSHWKMKWVRDPCKVHPLYELGYVITCVGNVNEKMSCSSVFECPISLLILEVVKIDSSNLHISHSGSLHF
jgi:hypothetical protein